jgi:uncharacterized protein (TIGR02186 family)
MRGGKFHSLASLIIFLGGFFLTGLLFSGPARAEKIVADISEHLIKIRSNFTGTSLLLFGAIDWKQPVLKSLEADGPDFDIIIIVRGPDSNVLIRRKDKIAGIWVNRKSVAVENVPSFYTILATRPVEEILSPKALKPREFTLENLKFEWPEKISANEQKEFREALLYNLREEELYMQRSGTVEIVGDTLFRAKVYFPAKVSEGAYLAEIYLVRDGRIIGSQTSALAVGKEGFERTIYEFAHEKPSLYGLIAIILALAAGLAASEIARRLS